MNIKLNGWPLIENQLQSWVIKITQKRYERRIVLIGYKLDTIIVNLILITDVLAWLTSSVFVEKPQFSVVSGFTNKRWYPKRI